MAGRRRKVWCEPLVGSQRYTVRLVPPESCPEIEGREACTIWESTEVLVRDDLSEERQHDCLAHEILGHALIDAIGLDHVLRDRLELHEDEWRDLDELLARVYVPAVLAVLKANGWINLPSLPRRSAGKASTRRRKR